MYSLVVTSGNLRSSLVTLLVRKETPNVKLLHFDYGQASVERERTMIRNIAERLQVTEYLEKQLPLLDIQQPFATTTLIWTSLIVAKEQHCSTVYWDPPEVAPKDERTISYIELIQHHVDMVQPEYQENGRLDPLRIQFQTPLILLTREQCLLLAHQNELPIEHTWDCGFGETFHCGECSGCKCRKRGFFEAGLDDPTTYRHFNRQGLRSLLKAIITQGDDEDVDISVGD